MVAISDVPMSEDKPSIARPGGLTRIEHDLDANSPETVIPGDALVDGSIRDGARFSATGNVVITGEIANARVHVGGSLEVGGITGASAEVCCGGDLRARLITGARVTCDGTIHVGVQTLNAQITCAGKLLMPDGVILSSQVLALLGVVCRSAGSQGELPTKLAVGVDSIFLGQLREQVGVVEKLRKVAQHIRTSVTPLMANVKHLNAQQKEKATELLYQADEAEGKIQDIMTHLGKERDRYLALPEPVIEVSEVIHGGVSIEFPAVHYVLTHALPGPAKLTSKTMGNEGKLFMTTAGEEEGRLLPAKPVPDETRALIRKFFAYHS